MYPTNHLQTECCAALGPMSAAIRAERVLRDAGVTAHVIALEPDETKRGCAFGIAYTCTEDGRVRATLRANRISVSQYFKKG